MTAPEQPFVGTREADERTKAEQQIVRLSLSDQEQVLELLVNPPAQNAAMARAMAAHKKLIQLTRS